MIISARAVKARCGVVVVPRPARDGGDGGGAGRAERQGDAVEEEGRGEGAEQEVLDGGLGAGGLAFAEAGHNVAGDGRDLEADEDHQELDRAGHEHHANGSEADEGEVLPGVSGVAVEVVERAEQGDEDDGGYEQMEEDGEGVDLDGAGEGEEGAEMKLPDGGQAGGKGAEDGEPAQGLAAGTGGEDGFEQHDGYAGQGEEVLGEEGGLR